MKLFREKHAVLRHDPRTLVYPWWNHSWFVNTATLPVSVVEGLYSRIIGGLAGGLQSIPYTKRCWIEVITSGEPS